MQKIRSKSYVGTFHTESAADMLELERIRKAIRVVNYQLRHFKYGSQEKKSGFGNEYYHQFYVKCAGRLGKNNPNAHKYYHDGFNVPYVRLEDAARVDAYVYQR